MYVLDSGQSKKSLEKNILELFSSKSNFLIANHFISAQKFLKYNISK